MPPCGTTSPSLLLHLLTGQAPARTEQDRVKWRDRVGEGRSLSSTKEHTWDSGGPRESTPDLSEGGRGAGEVHGGGQGDTQHVWEGLAQMDTDSFLTPDLRSAPASRSGTDSPSVTSDTTSTLRDLAGHMA